MTYWFFNAICQKITVENNRCSLSLSHFLSFNLPPFFQFLQYKAWLYYMHVWITSSSYRYKAFEWDMVFYFAALNSFHAFRFTGLIWCLIASVGFYPPPILPTSLPQPPSSWLSPLFAIFRRLMKVLILVWGSQWQCGSACGIPRCSKRAKFSLQPSQFAPFLTAFIAAIIEWAKSNYTRLL